MQGDNPETAMEVQKLMLRHVCLWRNKLEREVDTVDHWNMHQGGAQPVRQDSHLAQRKQRGVSIGSRFTGAVSNYLSGSESPSPARYQTSPRRGPPSPVSRHGSLWDAVMLEHHTDNVSISSKGGGGSKRRASFKSQRSQRGSMPVINLLPGTAATRGSPRSPKGKDSSPSPTAQSKCF